MTVRCSAVAIAALTSLVAATGVAEAQVELKWKLRANDVLKYSVEQETESKATVAGTEQSSQMNNTMDLIWRVDGVAANGDAALAQTISRIRISYGSGPLQGETLDSDDEELPENPFLQPMAKVNNVITNSEFKMTLKPNGQVENVTLPQKMMDELKQLPGASQLDESALQKIMQHSGVLLPDEPVSPGHRWTNKQELPLPYGVMSVVNALRYEGLEEGTQARIARISITPSISIEPSPNAPAQVELKEGTGTGYILFNLDTGRIAESVLNLTVVTSVTSDRFGVVEQRMKQKMVMRLMR